MSARIRMLATILLLAAVAWAGGEPWLVKNYKQWTADEIFIILTDSPWVKQTRVLPSWRGEARGEHEALPTFNRSMFNVGAGKRDDFKSLIETPKGVLYFISWDSARTLREAYSRSAVMGGRMKPEEAEAYLGQEVTEYQVTISGGDMSPFSTADEVELLQNTFLMPKKNGLRLYPSYVNVKITDDRKNITEVIFGFPRKSPDGQAVIEPDEQRVDFSCMVGKSTWKATFDPRRMATRLGRDL
jgi:hypothetical protein